MMIKAGVPVIAGYHGDNQSNETLLLEAKKNRFSFNDKKLYVVVEEKA